MADIKKELELATLPVMPKHRGYRIGIIGAGFIVQGCHLTAYEKAGFHPYAISCRSMEKSRRIADEFHIEKAYDDWKDLVDDPAVEIVDIAVPPHVQPEVVAYICSHAKDHVKGILCQKPIAMSVEDAKKIAGRGRQARIPIAVNSNMRYDQAMRAMKHILDRGLIGKPVLATIDMRATPDWQNFLMDYHKLEIYAMAVHHLDIFRYLFGEPEKITAVCRTDPRTKFPHKDGITQYTYQYKDGMMATSLDDVWNSTEEPVAENNYINWRVEGTEGYAFGDFGWHKREGFPGSSLHLACKAYPGEIIHPQWDTCWFPDAFIGTMASLMVAIETGTEPEISAEDNIKTLACVEACYASIEQERTVYLKEML